MKRKVPAEFQSYESVKSHKINNQENDHTIIIFDVSCASSVLRSKLSKDKTKVFNFNFDFRTQPEMIKTNAKPDYYMSYCCFISISKYICRRMCGGGNAAKVYELSNHQLHVEPYLSNYQTSNNYTYCKQGRKLDLCCGLNDKGEMVLELLNSGNSKGQIIAVLPHGFKDIYFDYATSGVYVSKQLYIFHYSLDVVWIWDNNQKKLEGLNFRNLKTLPLGRDRVVLVDTPMPGDVVRREYCTWKAWMIEGGTINPCKIKIKLRKGAIIANIHSFICLDRYGFKIMYIGSDGIAGPYECLACKELLFDYSDICFK